MRAVSSDMSCFFFFNDTATTEIYTLSLHDALPIYRLAGDLAYRDGGGRVGHEAFVADADVQGDDVSLLQAVGAGDAVNDHGVRRGADGGREALVALELGPAAVVVDKVLGPRVELTGGDAGADAPGEHPQAGGGDAATLAHRLQLGLALADDQTLPPDPSTASRISAVTSVMGCVASTCTRIPLL